MEKIKNNKHVLEYLVRKIAKKVKFIKTKIMKARNGTSSKTFKIL